MKHASFLSGPHGEVALVVAIVVLLIWLVHRHRSGSHATLTEIALAAAAGFAAFSPIFPHKPGPRVVAFAVMAVVILVLRSILKTAAKGKSDGANSKPASGFYPAGRAGRGGR